MPLHNVQKGSAESDEHAQQHNEKIEAYAEKVEGAIKACLEMKGVGDPCPKCMTLALMGAAATMAHIVSGNDPVALLNAIDTFNASLKGLVILDMKERQEKAKAISSIITKALELAVQQTTPQPKKEEMN
jgi:hypothetical protein